MKKILCRIGDDIDQSAGNPEGLWICAVGKAEILVRGPVFPLILCEGN